MGAVRRRKAAKGSAVGGAGGGVCLAGFKDPYSTAPNPYSKGGGGGLIVDIGGGGTFTKTLWHYDGQFHDQPPPSPAESGLQARVPSGADTGEPERADKPAEGGQQAGGVPDAGGGEAAGEVRAVKDECGGNHVAGLHRPSRVGAISLEEARHQGWKDGFREAREIWQDALRANTILSVSLAIGVAIIAVVLVTTKGVFGG